MSFHCHAEGDKPLLENGAGLVQYMIHIRIFCLIQVFSFFIPVKQYASYNMNFEGIYLCVTESFPVKNLSSQLTYCNLT